MKAINNQVEFDQIVNGTKPVLVDFYADWCGPCQTQLPIVEDLSQLHQEDFEVVKVNVDQQKELAAKFGIRSIPALFFIREGEILEKMVGLQTKSTLESKMQYYAQPKV
ncbi:thioredoxin [Crocinitomix algicola]|uniref:thioredoxin n=1 Tax=Crocinitomix algicola TaxID=1740263 RepID=UPI000835C458|nr:thioredoxin [Crocinitomix algicola]